MRRREFIALVGAAAAWPLASSGQQPEQKRRVGILMPLRENDSQSQLRITAFSQMLRQIGWVEGQTITFEKRFSDGNPERLVGLALANGSPACMTESQARAKFPKAHLIWLGTNHCWTFGAVPAHSRPPVLASESVPSPRPVPAAVPSPGPVVGDDVTAVQCRYSPCE